MPKTYFVTFIKCTTCSRRTIIEFSQEETQKNEVKGRHKYLLRKKKKKSCHSLYLLGIFVTDENDDWVDVNAVETFNGVRSNVK